MFPWFRSIMAFLEKEYCPLKQEQTSPLSVAIPKQLHTELKVVAARKDMPLKQVVTEALSSYLSTLKGKGAVA